MFKSQIRDHALITIPLIITRDFVIPKLSIYPFEHKQNLTKTKFNINKPNLIRSQILSSLSSI